MRAPHRHIASAGRDLLVAGVGAAILGVIGRQAAIGTTGSAPDLFESAMLVGVGAAAGLIRRTPIAALLVAVAGTVTYLVVGGPQGPIYVVPAIALAAVVASRGPRRAALAVVGAAAALATAGAVGTHDDVYGLLVGASAWATIATLAGVSVRLARARADESAARRAEAARRGLAEDRLALARDVHDVVGHGLAAISLQAGVAVHHFDQHPERAREALLAVREASVRALEELRSALATLQAESHRPGGDDASSDSAPPQPLPGVGAIAALVDRTRRAGLAVDAELDGAPAPAALPGGVGTVAYRIVQEALTNVVRHAGPDARARVRVALDGERLVVEVTDDGAGVGPNGNRVDAGTGIAGMRARVASVGGELVAGPVPAAPSGRTGFEVRALLPARATVAR